MRRTNVTGLFTEFSSGPGYSRTFLGGTTYEVDNKGKVNIINSAGYNYVMIILGGGLGYDFSKSKGKPFSIFYKEMHLKHITIGAEHLIFNPIRNINPN